ncbi:type 1 glutamine amidotransferase domain-containing protein [Sphingomonas sp.]|uniref:type 1 glutamine amidotransferase domain-containing protein n=1 Tax=Sphingomonas sp. TaxID=28214 RepID=UPI00286A39AB|nr:type 1 glutamine amidotransferase domain-containing protein [Sphingomonas sp.]
MTAIGDAHVLIMATDGFEESELFGPRAILIERGARVTLASPTRHPIQATVLDDPGRTIRPDLTIGAVVDDDYDALILPGGLRNPDALRTDAAAIALIRRFVAAGKPVAAICHGPWLLAEADVLRGIEVTCWRSIRTDLINAGANVVDAPAVTSGHIVTSRMPDDVPAFTAALIALIERSPA